MGGNRINRIGLGHCRDRLESGADWLAIVALCDPAWFPFR